MQEGVGYKNLSAAGTVDGTHAVIIHGFGSDGSTGAIDLYDGQDNSGVHIFDEANGKTYDLGCGVVFPSGCYVTFGGNATFVIVYYERLT